MILISGGIGLLVGYFWGFLIGVRAVKKAAKSEPVACIDEKTGNVTYLKRK